MMLTIILFLMGLQVGLLVIALILIMRALQECERLEKKLNRIESKYSGQNWGDY